MIRLLLTLNLLFWCLVAGEAQPAKDVSTGAPHTGDKPVIPARPYSTPEFIPFDFWHGLIRVQMTIGNLPSRPALLSTGLTDSLMSQEVAALLKATTGVNTHVFTLERTVTAEKTQPQDVILGQSKFSQTAFCILDLIAMLSASKPGDSPDLWVGASLFSNCSLYIDTTSMQLQIQRGFVSVPRGAIVVPLEVIDGRPWVKVKINRKKTFTALLELGTGASLIPARIARELKLKPGTVGPVTNADGKKGEITQCTVSDISVGSASLKNYDIFYLSSGEKPEFDQDFAILGADFLMQFRTTIDFKNKRLYLVRPDTPETPPSVKTSPDSHTDNAPPLSGNKPPFGNSER